LADLIRALDEEKLKRETEKRLNTIIPFGTFEDWYTDKDGNLKPKLKSFGEQILNPIPLFTLANLPEIPEWPNGATFISLPTKVIPMILVKRLNDININLDFNKSQSTSITDNPAANIIPTSLPIYVNFKGPSSLLGAAGSAVAEEQHGWKPSDFANLVDPIRFGGNDINIHINTNPKVVIPPIPPILPPPLDNTPVKGSAEILSEEVNTVMPIKNVMHGIKVDLGPI